LMKLNNAKHDLYIVMLTDPEFSIFLKQRNELDITADVTSNHVFGYVGDRRIIEGFWQISEPQGDDAFLEEIRAHNKTDNVFGAATAYDNVMLLVKAFEAAETKETAVDELIKIKEYDGVGGHLVQDERGIFQAPPVFARIIGGRAVEITEEEL